MRIKKESGITMTMLVITIIVMLIIASILTYYTVQKNSLINNASDSKFIEKISAIKDKMEEQEALKQDLAGDVNLTLSQQEISEILGEYINDFDVEVEKDTKNGQSKSVLKYKKNSIRFTDREKKILENKLNIQGK